jgi:hypothetical protein
LLPEPVLSSFPEPEAWGPELPRAAAGVFEFAASLRAECPEAASRCRLLPVAAELAWWCRPPPEAVGVFESAAPLRAECPEAA